MRNFKAYSAAVTILLAWLLLGYVAQKEELERSRAQLATVSTIAGRCDAELSNAWAYQSRITLAIERFADVCYRGEK